MDSAAASPPAGSLGQPAGYDGGVRHSILFAALGTIVAALGTSVAITGCGADESSGGTGGGSAGGAGGSGAAGGVGASGGNAGSGGTPSCTADLSSDPGNCGACGTSCFGGTCTQGTCSPVALSSSGTPKAIAVNESAVVWGDSDGKVSLRGLPQGTPKTLATSNGYVSELVLDAKNAYWTSTNMISAYQVPLAGGPLVTLFDSGASPAGIAVTATDVYVSQNGWPGSIRKVPIGGGALSVVVAASWVPKLFIEGDTMFWISYDYAKPETSAVTRMPLTGGAPQNLVTGIGYVTGLALDATYAYWVDGAGGTVSRVPKAGGSPTTLATGLQSPQRVAVNGDEVFVTQQGSGTGPVGSVLRLPASGGTPTVLATDQHHPTEIVATARGVFWINEGDQGSGGAVMAMGK